nr:uncharacterized protein LOC114820924 [Malus domestica]
MVWVEDKEDLKQIAVHHFCSLFADSNGVMPNLFPYVDQSLLGALKEDVSLQEVKDSLFSIGAFKAPRPNDGLGSTLITLVPKVDGPQDISQFRPISLCSTLYKVVTKILVNRLKPIMKSVIIPNQVSFIPGRHITDNIIIAQEVLHTFSITRGARGYMAWKIYLSKAYDRLRWDFIREVLVEVGIDDLTVKLIMDCVSKVDYKIVVNGECSTSFRPKRGVRQGDPLSPYLFVLCVEKFGHLISEAVSNKCWKPVKVAKNGSAISHLFFADDIILFSEASISQAKVVKHGNFCGVLLKSSKTCLVRWSSVCLQKNKGGLGLKRMKYMNAALLAKSSWRLLQRDDDLWASTFRGANTSFWFDAWLDDGILANKALIPLDVSAKAVKRAVLLEEYVWKISAIPIGLNDGDSDCIIWKHSNDGNFSVKSAYLASIDDEDFVDWSWSDIWKLKLPPRVLHFLWLTLHGRLLCNEQRAKRRITDNSYCDFCDGCVESIDHILRRCDRANQPYILIFKAAKEWFEVQNFGAKPVKSRIFLAWDPPSPNYVKLNADGSRKSGKGCSSAGGILRAAACVWIAGFTINIGVGSVLNAEL